MRYTFEKKKMKVLIVDDEQDILEFLSYNLREANFTVIKSSDGIDALNKIKGAYSLVILTNKKLIGVKDPLGIRPLVLGSLNGSYVLASETCALDIIGAKFIRDIENGEIISIEQNQIQSFKPFKKIQYTFV